MEGFGKEYHVFNTISVNTIFICRLPLQLFQTDEVFKVYERETHTHTHSLKRFKKALIFQLHFIAMYFVNANFPNKKLVATQAFAISRLKNQTTKSSTSPNRYKMSIRSKTSLLKIVQQRANLFVPYSMQVTTVHSYNC